jgi:mono/diheme cytochrome c family protein
MDEALPWSRLAALIGIKLRDQGADRGRTHELERAQGRAWADEAGSWLNNSDEREYRRMKPCLVLFALLGAALAAAPAGARETNAEAQGRRIAEARCGQCHALGAGPSPLKDAPPFATLHRRYPEGGGLRDLLGEGMIAPATPPEEGQPRMHPRMPQARLDDDEVAALVAFLKSVQGPDAEHP